MKALSYSGFKAPYDLSHKEHKGKEKLFLVLFVCFVVSIQVSTCINPHVYGAFKLKSVPLLSAVLIETLTEKVAANPVHYNHSENVDRLFLEELLMSGGSLKLQFNNAITRWMFATIFLPVSLLVGWQGFRVSMIRQNLNFAFEACLFRRCTHPALLIFVGRIRTKIIFMLLIHWINFVLYLKWKLFLTVLTN